MRVAYPLTSTFACFCRYICMCTSIRTSTCLLVPSRRQGVATFCGWFCSYESLKAEEVTEMQTALEAKYGVVPRKRVPLMVNETVVLYFKVRYKTTIGQIFEILQYLQQSNARITFLHVSCCACISCFQAFVKCLSLQQWGVHLEGGQQVNTHFGSLKDEFFMSLRDLPQLTKEPRNTQASNLPFSNSFTK